MRMRMRMRMVMMSHEKGAFARDGFQKGSILDGNHPVSQQFPTVSEERPNCVSAFFVVMDMKGELCS